MPYFAVERDPQKRKVKPPQALFELDDDLESSDDSDFRIEDHDDESDDDSIDSNANGKNAGEFCHFVSISAPAGGKQSCRTGGGRKTRSLRREILKKNYFAASIIIPIQMALKLRSPIRRT